MDLVTQDSTNLLNQIYDAQSVEQVLSMLKQLKVLKQALEAVDRFHENSVMFARLEAEALLKVFELGGINNLRGYKKKTAEWLSSISQEERAYQISRCSDGATIEAIYRHEHPDDRRPSQKEKADNHVSFCFDEIMEAVEQEKPINLNKFADAVKEADVWRNPTEKVGVGDAVDSIRHKLRDCGYVGVGERSGDYYPAKPEYKEQIAKAINTRVKSIINDVYSLRYIMNNSNVGKLSVWDFAFDDEWHMHRNKDVAYPLFLFLYYIDVIDDIESYENREKIKWDRTNLYAGY